MKAEKTSLVPKVRRRRAVVGTFVLGAALAGCTILAPIQTPVHDRRFALDIKDTEEVPCVDPDDGRSRLCTAKVKESLDEYYGDLGRAMWETDLRRRRLVAMGVEKAQLANVYNALLWPLGAYFITKKIHHPEWSTLDTAAVATATYGVLNSGIPERDKLYLRAASRMACAMVVFEPYMYRVDRVEKQPKDKSNDQEVLEVRTRQFDWAIGKSGSAMQAYETVARIDKNPGRYDPASESLEALIRQLERSIRAFENQRDVLVADIQPSPAKAAPPARTFNSISEVRAEALGKRKAAAGTPAGNMNTFMPGFQGETDRLLANARAQLLEARKSLALLRTSGTRLRQVRGRIDFALTDALVAGTPALATPEARAQAIAAAMTAHLTASKAFSDKVASIRKQSGTAQEALWTVTDARLKVLSEDSQQDVRDFWNGQRRELLDAQQHLTAWTDELQANVKIATDSATTMGCDDGSLDEFSKQLLKLVNDAADAAAAAATPPASGASK